MDKASNEFDATYNVSKSRLCFRNVRDQPGVAKFREMLLKELVDEMKKREEEKKEEEVEEKMKGVIDKLILYGELICNK